MKSAALVLPAFKDDVVELKGGLDQVTPALKLYPGAARRALNFEAAINGGYRRIHGYERYDGHTSPSSATFTIIPIGTFTAIPNGGTIVGATSGTTATWVGVSSANRYIAVTQIVGSGFVVGEIVTNAGGTILGDVASHTVTLTPTLKKQYLSAAADVYRALIGAPTGSMGGKVLGAFGYTNAQGEFSVYAFRDHDIGGTAGIQAVLSKATPAGWVSVPMYNELEFFNAGPIPIEEGVHYDYFGNDVTIKRVMLQGGSWAANTASGLLIVDVPGSFHPILGPTYTIGATTFLSKHSAVAIRISPGGRFKFVLSNFGGRLSTSRIYGCDGANRAFEFDGDIYAPIASGVEPYNVTNDGVFTSLDRPSDIIEHQKHLFLMIGSSYLHSGPGEPYNFSSVAGAGENAVGDTGTGFQVLPGVQASGSLAVFTRNHTKILYGTALGGPEPFDLVNFQTETGAVPFTMQTLDRVYYLDDRGVIDLKTAQDYGNFLTATVTRYIQRFIEQKKGRAVCSMIHREKGQYRLFFSDGSGLYITFDNGKLRGAMPMAFHIPMSCAWSGEDSNGNEISLVGGNDGFLYQFDRGTSFDGNAIDWELLLGQNTMSAPRVRKTIHRASVEIQDTDYVECSVGARLGPAITAHTQDAPSALVTEQELAMQWDHFTWDNFWWDAHTEAPLEVDVKGTAERVQYVFRGSSAYISPFTLTSVITHYISRRGLR